MFLCVLQPSNQIHGYYRTHFSITWQHMLQQSRVGAPRCFLIHLYHMPLFQVFECFSNDSTGQKVSYRECNPGEKTTYGICLIWNITYTRQLLTLPFSMIQESQIGGYYYKIVMQSRFLDLPKWQEMDDIKVKTKPKPNAVKAEVLDMKFAMI